MLGKEAATTMEMWKMLNDVDQNDANCLDLEDDNVNNLNSIDIPVNKNLVAVDKVNEIVDKFASSSSSANIVVGKEETALSHEDIENLLFKEDTEDYQLSKEGKLVVDSAEKDVINEADIYHE